MLFYLLLLFIFCFRKYVNEESIILRNKIIKEIQNKLISLIIYVVTRINRSFLGIHLQYVIDGKIVLRTIGLIELTESHTGTNLNIIPI